MGEQLSVVVIVVTKVLKQIRMFAFFCKTMLWFLGTRGAVLHHSAEMVLLGYLGWVGLG